MLRGHRVFWPALGVLSVALTGFVPAETEDPPIVNAEAAKLKNPLTSDTATIEVGEELYLTHCAQCHGKKGKGDGGQTLGGGMASDLTDASWDYGGTDGEIFWIIKEGVPENADMLAYKKTLSEKEMWQIVVFIRGLAKK